MIVGEREFFIFVFMIVCSDRKIIVFWKEFRNCFILKKIIVNDGVWEWIELRFFLFFSVEVMLDGCSIVVCLVVKYDGNVFWLNLVIIMSFCVIDIIFFLLDD